MKKKFSFLNRSNKNQNNNESKKLYQDITNIPYSEEIEDFEETFNFILENDLIGDDLKLYLEDKYELKKQWVKPYMKDNFCLGTCTSSRIESKHSIYKR